MQRIDTRHPTQYPPLEQGQVVAMNDHCMQVNFGFRFIRGVLSGMLLAILSMTFVLDLIVLATTGKFFATGLVLGEMYRLINWIAPVVIVELYLWPSAPPMIFDRVNRRVIFQVFFRTKILDWDSCEGTIRYAAQVTESSATQGYNLRIAGNVINRKPGEKPQRAGALIHQSGNSDDLFSYWEYLRAYMDGGPEAVPAPLKLNERNPLAAGWYAFKRNYPGLAYAKLSWLDLKQPNRPLYKKFIDLLFLTTSPLVMLMMMPLVVPLFTVAFIAAKTGRVRRYPKAIRQLCRGVRASAPVSIPGKLKIHIDGKPLEIDWPVEEIKPPPSNKPPPEE